LNLGRVTQTTFPSTLAETYGYDQLYNLPSKTDRKNQTIQYVYDSLYRMTSKTYPDQSAASYAYDLVGKIQQVTDPTGTYVRPRESRQVMPRRTSMMGWTLARSARTSSKKLTTVGTFWPDTHSHKAWA
jgi:YD repeat-containing protein